jgi:hypothetical protein
LIATSEDTAVTFNVLANDSDPDGDPIIISSFTFPTHGQLISGGAGSFTFTPAANFNGSDSFTYTIRDGKGGEATATVSITVNPVPDLPIANNDSVTADEDTCNHLRAR